MLTDGGYDDMLDALHRFEERLRERGGTALFHCGGHGVQVNGVNYLLPVDRNIPDERRVRSLAISADEISGALQGPGARPTSLFWTPAGTTRCPVKPGAPMSAVRRR